MIYTQNRLVSCLSVWVNSKIIVDSLNSLNKKIITTLFFEPSIRTRPLFTSTAQSIVYKLYKSAKHIKRIIT